MPPAKRLQPRSPRRRQTHLPRFRLCRHAEDFTGACTRSGKNLICASASAILWRDSTDGSPRKTTTPRLHRLDARPRLPADVSNALLRFVARRRRARRHLSSSGRNSAERCPLRSFFSLPEFPSRSSPTACAARVSLPTKLPVTTIRRGAEILRTRSAVSRAGIRSRPAVGAVDRSAARGRAEHDRSFDDAHGNRFAPDENPRCQRNCRGARGIGHCARHAAAMDHLATPLAAVVSRVVHQRRSHLRQAATVAVPNFSLDGICIRRARAWVFAVQRMGDKRTLAKLTALVGVAGSGALLFLKWLDARPRQFYAVYDYWHTSPNFFLARVGILMMIVFLAYAWCRWGAGQWGFSPLIQIGQTSLARLLGAHRICVRAILDSTEARADDSDGDVRLSHYFRSDGSAFDGAHTIQGTRR